MIEESICQNCSYFFSDAEDETGLGVCMRDEAFESFADDIMECSSFACCYELYLEKRFDGEKAACSDFEEVEIIEDSDADEIYGYLLHESLKNQNVDEIINKLYSLENKEIEQAVTSLSGYIAIGNNDAFEGLLNYYKQLPPADNLKDVHVRVKIVNALAYRKTEKDTINAYINELSRTPSNNTTRKLYSEILLLLGRCPLEMIEDPLLELLANKQFSYKIKNRIYEIMEM